MTPAKRKFVDVPTVTLIVGENKKPFQVHLDLLCEASPIFKAAFSGNFKESSEKTMQLPADDESIFELFVDWLYYQRYEMIPEVEGDEYEASGVFLQAFKLFVIADKYEVIKLKSRVIETLFVAGKVSKWGLTLSSLDYAYEHTTQGSGLRKLLADSFAWNIDLEWYERPRIQGFLRQRPDLAADIIASFVKYLKRRKDQNYNSFNEDMPEEYKDKDLG